VKSGVTPGYGSLGAPVLAGVPAVNSPKVPLSASVIKFTSVVIAQLSNISSIGV